VNPGILTPAVGRASRVESPAAGLAQRSEARTNQLADLALKLDRIHTKLYGPRPEVAGEPSEKLPPAQGFFDAIDRQLTVQEQILERAHTRADQILEALEL
jgi:hypothetical protein